MAQEVAGSSPVSHPIFFDMRRRCLTASDFFCPENATFRLKKHLRPTAALAGATPRRTSFAVGGCLRFAQARRLRAVWPGSPCNLFCPESITFRLKKHLRPTAALAGDKAPAHLLCCWRSPSLRSGWALMRRVAREVAGSSPVRFRSSISSESFPGFSFFVERRICRTEPDILTATPMFYENQQQQL